MGIRVNTGLAEIEVNDNGDKISFSISDNDFLKRLSGFFDWFFDTKKEIENKEKKINESESDEIDDFKLLVAAQEGLSKQAQEKLDELFGSETSKKIFGAISPTFVCVVDVIFQLSNEIERIAKEHNQYFTSKYTKNRKGAKS